MDGKNPNIIDEDLSRGKAVHKIPVINEVDQDDVESHFLYIEHNVDDRVIKDKDMIGCKCEGECKKSTCECIQKSSIELYKDGRVKNAAGLHTKFYDTMLYECDSATCKCGGNCLNRMTPPRFNLKMELFKTKYAGYGVRSRQYIQYGTFIAEFVGEILSYREAASRQSPEDYSYQVVNDNSKDGHYVDPTRYGNITRFFNHSCFENLLPMQFFSHHRDKKRASIGFVACRDILPGDELTIDYGDAWWDRNVRGLKPFFCRCDAAYCVFPPPEKRQCSKEEAKRIAVALIRERHKQMQQHKRNNTPFVKRKIASA